jgi:hypothetical protein
MKKLIITDQIWICGLDWIRSDLVSRTSDEKHKCMGYDRMQTLHLLLQNWYRDHPSHNPHGQCFTVSDSKAMINDFKTQLQTKWTVSDLGAACFCLGIALEWDHTSRTISLSQHTLIDKVIKQFSLTKAAPVSTPIEPGLYLSRKQHTPSSDQECELMNWMPYCSLISPLMPRHCICHSAIIQVS